MLKPLLPSFQGRDQSKYTPPLLVPLIAAAEKGLDLRPVVQSITVNLGFDSFMYGVSTSLRPNHETRNFVFTTLPIEWVMHYDQASYLEVDPRFLCVLETRLPYIWDHVSERGKNPRTDSFLDDAAAFGICSGMSFSFYDGRPAFVLIALNSAIPVVDDVRQGLLARNLPDIMVFGHFFHELFMQSVIHRNIPPTSTGAPLSPRERECLNLAARGLTSDDIAARLEISPRTVQFHFDGIRSKLNAANRGEAIAVAIKAGLIAA